MAGKAVSHCGKPITTGMHDAPHLPGARGVTHPDVVWDLTTFEVAVTVSSDC